MTHHHDGPDGVLVSDGMLGNNIRSQSAAVGRDILQILGYIVVLPSPSSWWAHSWNVRLSIIQITAFEHIVSVLSRPHCNDGLKYHDLTNVACLLLVMIDDVWTGVWSIEAERRAWHRASINSGTERNSYYS